MRPKLICLTPVKNEAWILDAFLTVTSLWADYIIVADQNSTDGSREIYKKYPKVIVVENNDVDLHETNRQRLLFDAARKIDGDKVFIALDADEIFTANYYQTNDWQKIKNAKAGDMFNFQWAELNEKATHYKIEKWFQWGMFDDGTNPPKDGKIHIARVPWTKTRPDNEVFVKDFYVIHLQYLNKIRLLSKEKYYQCFLFINENKNAISANRGMRDVDLTDAQTPIPDYFFDNYKKQNIDIEKLIDFLKTYCWQDEKVLEYFNEKGIKFFRKLNIWDRAYLAQLSKIAGKEIKDPRNTADKIVHFYLQKTKSHNKNIFIRIFDKLLKKIGY
ncbi:MAG: glycosyltransferase family 2 protein [Paludibacter sp.]|nr:glycosyltransferase family 2 protein [Paludibacter sp.]